MTDEFDIFLTYYGDCREAIDFYAEVFGIDHESIMITTYGEVDLDGAHPEMPKERIIYAEMVICGRKVLLSDVPGYYQPFYKKGNNLILALALVSKEMMSRVFNAFAKDGTVIFGIEETIAVESLGIVMDKFGVTWQFSAKPKGPGNPYLA